MESIKRFWLDEAGSSEAASSVLLIAGVAGLILAVITTYYGAISGFFTRAAAWIDSVGFSAS